MCVSSSIVAATRQYGRLPNARAESVRVTARASVIRTPGSERLSADAQSVVARTSRVRSTVDAACSVPGSSNLEVNSRADETPANARTGMLDSGAGVARTTTIECLGKRAEAADAEVTVE